MKSRMKLRFLKIRSRPKLTKAKGADCYRTPPYEINFRTINLKPPSLDDNGVRVVI